MADLWRPATQPPPLSQDEVHVWRLALDQPAPSQQRLEQFLSPAEVRRADRFHLAHDRRRFVVSHGALRWLLGRYLEQAPASIQFYHGPHGKPYCAAALDAAPLQFNLAHSGAIALFGFTRHRLLGIDIELRQPLADLRAIATQFFSPAEARALLALPAPLQLIGFYNCWSRKEAYIKAIGKGLSQPLDSFDVTLCPGEPACLLRVADQPTAQERWQMRALEPHSDYAAAVVIEGTGWQLHRFDLQL